MSEPHIEIDPGLLQTNARPVEVTLSTTLLESNDPRQPHLEPDQMTVAPATRYSRLNSYRFTEGSGTQSQRGALWNAYRQVPSMTNRDALFLEYSALVQAIATKFVGQGVELDDLRQAGAIGLMKAIGRFDSMRGIQFSSFATPTISGEIRRYLRDKGWLVNVPSHLKQRATAVSRSSDALSQQLGRSPTVPELAAATCLAEIEIRQAQTAGAAYRVVSLGAHRESEGGQESVRLDDFLGYTDPALGAVDDRLSLRDALSALDRREQKVVVARFFKLQSQAKVGQQLGLSQKQVSRLEQQALLKLRHHLSNNGVDHGLTPLPQIEE